MNKKLVLILSAVVLGTGAVFGSIHASQESAADAAERTARETCMPADYTHGIYYFPCIGEKFGTTLGKFLEAHPAYHVAALSENGTGRYGKNTGYFVVIAP